MQFLQWSFAASTFLSEVLKLIFIGSSKWLHQVSAFHLRSVWGQISKVSNVCYILSAQRILVKTTQKTDGSCSAFCVIVYCKIFVVRWMALYFCLVFQFIPKSVHLHIYPEIYLWRSIFHRSFRKNFTLLLRNGFKNYRLSAVTEDYSLDIYDC